jgi:DNA polymerase III epsilon subunit family exonuclease
MNTDFEKKFNEHTKDKFKDKMRFEKASYYRDKNTCELVFICANKSILLIENARAEIISAFKKILPEGVGAELILIKEKAEPELIRLDILNFIKNNYKSFEHTVKNENIEINEAGEGTNCFNIILTLYKYLENYIKFSDFTARLADYLHSSYKSNFRVSAVFIPDIENLKEAPKPETEENKAPDPVPLTMNFDAPDNGSAVEEARPQSIIIENIPRSEKLENLNLDKFTYVVFDIETTGLDFALNKIIEIGAVKLKNGEITETFSQLIDPMVFLPSKIIELTGITEDDLKGKPAIEKVLPQFYEFCKNSVLVGHNIIDFDMKFIDISAKNLNIRFDNKRVDTLLLARKYLRLPNYKLATVAQHLGVELINAHRAMNDVRACAEVFKRLVRLI